MYNIMHSSNIGNNDKQMQINAINTRNQKKCLTCTSFHNGVNHKVDKTEGALDQLPIWIFNCQTYGLWAAQGSKGEKTNYEL